MKPRYPTGIIYATSIPPIVQDDRKETNRYTIRDSIDRINEGQSLPARGLRFPNLDRFNRPIVFRLNATVDPFFRPAGYIRSKGSFDFDSLFEPGPPRGPTTVHVWDRLRLRGRRRPRSGIVRTMAWLTRASRPLLSCPLLLSTLQRLLDPVQSIINAG